MHQISTLESQKMEAELNGLGMLVYPILMSSSLNILSIAVALQMIKLIYLLTPFLLLMNQRQQWQLLVLGMM